MSKRAKRTTEDTFKIYRSMVAQIPIARFAMATKCVTDIQEFEFIETVLNKHIIPQLELFDEKGKPLEEKPVIKLTELSVVNRIIWNRFEQGVVKDLKQNMDIVGRGALMSANLKKTELGDEDEDEEVE